MSGDESGNEHEPANTEPSTQPSASQERANLQHDIGVVDGDAVAILTTRRTALPLWEVTPSKARMRMPSSRHEGSAAR